MFAHPIRWLVLTGVGLVFATGACVQVAAPPIPLPAGQAAAPAQEGTLSFTAAATAAPTADVAAIATAVAAPGGAEAGTTKGKTSVTPTPRPLAGRQVPVRLGSITNIAQLSGRVAALKTAPLAFPIIGRVDVVSVEAGMPVQAGQVLVTLDSKDATRSLGDAQAELQITLAKLEQLQARVDASGRSRLQLQAEATQRDRAAAQAAQLRTADAIAQAQEQLRQAQANLDKVSAGAPAAERLAAQVAVVTARGTLDKAQAELTRLRSGPAQADVLAAEQEVAAASIAVRKAQADRDKLVAPPDPALVAGARRAVADAQAEVERASSPPSKTGPQMSEGERERRLESAQLAVTGAKNQLETLLKGPDKSSVDLANMALESAKNLLRISQARSDLVKAGPTADQLSAAANAVETARIALEGAQSRAAEVNGHPTPAELTDAETRVAQAQAALDRASAGGANDLPSTTASTSADVDDSRVLVLQLQHTLDQQQAQIAGLRQQVEGSQLRAPYNGLVESVQAKSGDTVEAGKQIVVLATSDEPIVTVDTLDTPTSRPELGDQVQVKINGTVLAGQIAALSDASAGSGRVAQIRVAWANMRPVLGSAAQVSMTLARKDQALVVPRKAVRSTGSRKFVQVVDGTRSKATDVTVGITSGDEVEILTGVTEGQLVVVPD